MNKILLALSISLILASGCSNKVQRFGSVIGVKEDMIEKYKELHANPWPEINDKLKKVNIQNYSIYLTQFPDGKYYLFGYFEYTGDNFEADMAKVDNDPVSKAWMKFTDEVCQIPVPTRREGEWWAFMEEVFYKK